jgi:hypothetical protein
VRAPTLRDSVVHVEREDHILTWVCQKPLYCFSLPSYLLVDNAKVFRTDNMFGISIEIEA